MLTSLWIAFVGLLSLFASAVGQGDVGKLPYCLENYVPGLVLVSTIDGRFSAITSEGKLKWQVETDPGPLLTSNIHQLELTSSGKWVRIIPSLTGALYRFDGNSVDPIPISAESLLRSSFKYSDDLVIAGGLDVRTYALGLRSGKIFYTCSSVKCSNNTSNDNEVDDILILERSTQTVRAIESQSGHERWNFSVGHHNMKLPQVTCADQNNPDQFNWNITTIIPDGLVLASNFANNVEITWQYQFGSPIVRVWKWNGHKLSEINLFATKSEQNTEASERNLSPAIYIGMHKKQLYIHESDALLQKTNSMSALAETKSVTRIPWKPVPASGLLTEDDSTALSVLYSSEYVNGHGYYLFTEEDVKKKNTGLCGKNYTSRFKFPQIGDPNDDADLGTLLFWWKEIVVIIITSGVAFNIIFRQFSKHNRNKEVIFVERHVEVPAPERQNSERLSESSDTQFVSRYMNDFDTLRCLGKGGFGIVFEVKQKIDECHYAIKRIELPKEESRRETVMREVKALAKLEHHNIVRYFNSWVEKPPCGWQEQHDSQWDVSDPNEFTFTSDAETRYRTHTRTASADFKVDVSNLDEDADSFIVFGDDDGPASENNNRQAKSDREISTKTDTTSCGGGSSRSQQKINWQKPSRCYHDLNTEPNPPALLYIQMQLCQRQSLKDWLVENKQRNFTDVLHIFKQILAAVEYVHLQGLIHRDLKPSNIFFSLDGKIKVGDFGLVKDVEDSNEGSKVYASSRNSHTKEVGTKLYMSPEQMNGRKYNYKVDIYSLGLIFFELLVHFSTDMERINTFSSIRTESRYPEDFVQNHPQEHQLLTQMLCHLPEKRLTTIGIRARPPINCCDATYNEAYDFELPKSKNKQTR